MEHVVRGLSTTNSTVTNYHFDYRMEAKQSKSIRTHLLSILHAAHTARCSTLYPHRIPLRPWRSISLPWVGASLLGPGPCGRTLLLLGVGIGPSIWLATHLPYLVHRAWGLEDTERQKVELREPKLWTDSPAILPSKRQEGNNCLSFTHCVGVDVGVSAASIRRCSHTLQQAP